MFNFKKIIDKIKKFLKRRKEIGCSITLHDRPINDRAGDYFDIETRVIGKIYDLI